MTYESLNSTLTGAVYTALGQAVDYTPTGATGSTAIYAIVNLGSVDFPDAFTSPTAEPTTVARVQVSDVALPKRGDTIEMADTTVYYVDAVRRRNEVEWDLDLRDDN